MKRNSRKKNVYVNPKEQDALQFKAFCLRLQTICQKMVGAEYFNLIPFQVLRLLYIKRYPRVKLVLDDDVISGREDQRLYQQTFMSLFKQNTVQTLHGEKIEIMYFFSEVLLIVSFIEHISEKYIKAYKVLQSAFEPYYLTGDWFVSSMHNALAVLSYANYRFYDLYKGTVQLDVSEFIIYKPNGAHEIRLTRVKNNVQMADVDGKKRPVAQLAKLPLGKSERTGWIMVRPDQLGLHAMKDQTAKPIFVQQHALERLYERAFCPPGYLQTYMDHIFSGGEPETVVCKEHVLLACRCVDHKVGYFVISFLGDKWLVRTFLFLTNEGTPEGDKLKQLTALQKDDRQYLMIDRMDAFLKYDIENDKRLKDLFTTAGCESIFAYANLFARQQEDFKSAEHIAHYLLVR